MKNTRKLLLALFVTIFLMGCTNDWLDINNDPNSPTTPELSQLLSGSEYFMTQGLGQGNFIGDNLSSYVHYTVSRDVQNYGMSTQANNPFNTWNYLYTYTLQDFDAIINFAEPAGNMIYAGIAKTLKAYVFSVMVDLWGDIPYSEFNIPGLIAPNPDSSKDIYNALIALLEEGKSNLQDTEAANLIKPETDDFFYSGDVDKWSRLNNTIKLKLLLQSRKAKSDISDWQNKLNALIADNKFIVTGEDFQFWFNEKTNPTDMRHPAFVNGYAGQHTFFINPYFYEIMKGETYNVIDNPFAGINDPRVPYYFYNQLNGGDSENAHEYRNGDFMSIFFAANGPNSAHSGDESYTKIGIYAAGGRYDDGKGGAVSLDSGTGAAPHKMITYGALKFMLAELALTGETSSDARALLTEALTASIAHVNTVAEAAKKPDDEVPLITDEDRDTFIEAVLAKYDAADADGKMEIVMTQKWIANFMNPVDAYTDYRRTGFPKLFDPQKTQDPGYGVNPTVADRSPAQVPITNIASYPRSLYYPTNAETELNKNMTQKTNLSTPFVFWDK
ncbi:SusD/RagB family nutrient-binding outer membrane lipoprotein [Sunxiuqinia elliptica]|uniref:SusD-like starch-binding protein associating with outer membrane n=1 Tax=Sunxiuqinia elliptica TaxID=655355 RepID=A0A4R6H3A0_9BACT|nr:SusD/RagB family nutrient-binding outer membrane lipoprotein [Sunxiuqinia elliptica]TDO02623.1 SusD-like starch-binding protein associating with outer membrane [Sunxiuqinia elliptica]TDO58639.1 SusD-like starch-binding protein associating with outer membrane [Sunxiuqinia elliptica]